MAPGKNNEALDKTLFLGQLPSTIRPLLTVWEEENLDKLAKLAEKILDANNPNVFAVAYYGLLIDLRTVQLIDSTTSLTSKGKLCRATSFNVSTIYNNMMFSKLLTEFHDITVSS